MSLIQVEGKVFEMKCQHHSKHMVLWWDKCVERDVKNYWSRISECAWLIGIEASITSLGKIQVEQTKEKWGSTHVYYSHYPCDKINEGMVECSPVWLAKEEGLLIANQKDIDSLYNFLMRKARKLLKKYVNKPLPKTGRIFFGFAPRGSARVSHQIPKYVWKAMERQRRLNPDIAHYIFDFAPYNCNCKKDFLCEKYLHVNPVQRLWDRIIIKLLKFYGTHSSRWLMLEGGFVLFGRQWGSGWWMKVKRTFRNPL